MTTIAVFGTSGALGPSVLKALTSDLFAAKISYPILAITSKDKSAESTDKVQFIQRQLTDKQLIEDLKNVDVIISLLKADVTLNSQLEQILVQVKPKLYIPSDYGHEMDAIDKELWSPLLVEKNIHFDNVKKHGIKMCRIMTSYFKYFFDIGVSDHVGVNQKDGILTVVDGANVPEPPVYFTTNDDIARTIGVVATTDPAKVLDQYHVIGGKTTAKEIVAKYEANTGTKYKVKHITLKEQIESTKKNLDDFLNTLFTYTSLNTPVHNDNELINPHESLWKWESEF